MDEMRAIDEEEGEDVVAAVVCFVRKMEPS